MTVQLWATIRPRMGADARAPYPPSVTITAEGSTHEEAMERLRRQIPDGWQSLGTAPWPLRGDDLE